MARFVFRLESVLKQRLAVERQKQLALGAIERERAALEDVIRACQTEIVREKEELREQLSAGSRIDLRGVRFQAGASLRLITQAQQAVLRLAGVCKRVDAARLELLQATTRRKAVEVIRERRLDEWKHEQKRRENAAADELGVMFAARSGEVA